MFLATQSLKVSKLKNMHVRFDGKPQTGVTSKDIVLYLIGKIGTAGGNGHAIEFFRHLYRKYFYGSKDDYL